MALKLHMHRTQNPLHIIISNFMRNLKYYSIKIYEEGDMMPLYELEYKNKNVIKNIYV